jgi:hypothetical protein
VGGVRRGSSSLKRYVIRPFGRFAYDGGIAGPWRTDWPRNKKEEDSAHAAVRSTNAHGCCRGQKATVKGAEPTSVNGKRNSTLVKYVP